MAVNKYQPHVLVLPEDDANRQLANGFVLSESVPTRQIQVLEEAGGWLEVLHCFEADHVDAMDRYPERFMILLIDFDGNASRLDDAKTFVPQRLTNRVFVLGALNEPEDIRRALGPYETVGLAMAQDCHEGTDSTWGHALLRHNASELERLRNSVRPILF